MIKTLRITSVIVAIAAAVLLILPVVYGVRSDPKIEEFLKKPGVVERFTAAGGQNPAKSDLEKNPLMSNAAGFSSYLNPPPPPQPKAAPGATRQGAAQPPAPPVPVAVKFDLVATSYYASNPEKSFVLIDEAGKGLHWVKQGSTLGHVTIETIKDGAIIVRDGSRTSEMTVKVKENWRGLLKNPPPTTRTISTSPSPVTAIPAIQTPSSSQGIEPSPAGAARQGAAPMPTRRTLRPGTAGRITQPSATPAQPALPPVPSNVERPATAVQTPPAPEASITAEPVNTATPNAELSPEKQAEMDKLITDIAASKVTGDEAAQMEKLVEAMKKLENEGEATPPEPNTPK
jgi:hypothetical protein